jgi:AcrR family transcriptional regulator
MSDNVVIEQKQTWKERRKQQLYDELVQSAIKLFGEKGVDGPSVDEIVAETGIAKGTFYLYFKTKSDIVQAVIVAGISELEQRVTEASAHTPEQAPEALSRIVEAVMAFFKENHSMIALLMTGNGISSNQLTIEVRDELRKRYRNATCGAYERIIRKGMLQGHFREIDAHTAANALSGVLAGLMHETIDTNGDFTGISEQALDIVIKGITRRG